MKTDSDEAREVHSSGDAVLSSPALKHCPFHAHESNLAGFVGEWFSNQRIAFWAVFCEACSAHGPEAETKEEAIEVWNTRFTMFNVPERDSETQ